MNKLVKKLASRLNVGYIAAGLMLVGAGVARAEGEAFDITQITAAQTAVSTGLKSIITGAMNPLLGLIFAGLGIWGIFYVVSLLKGGANKSKPVKG